MTPYLIVAVSGALGSVLRYWVFVTAQHRFGVRFPYGTVFVNITGCFLIGLVVTLLAEKSFPNHPQWRLALVTGFLGGYTTFSAYVWDSDRLMRDGEWVLATVNLVGTVLACLLAFRVGHSVARAFL